MRRLERVGSPSLAFDPPEGIAGSLTRGIRPVANEFGDTYVNPVQSQGASRAVPGSCAIRKHEGLKPGRSVQTAQCRSVEDRLTNAGYPPLATLRENH